MEIREIEAFVQVALQGSFTRAADVLGTNQPALSRLVRCLEAKLAQTLLVRNGRGATLTKGGETFLVHCKDILELVQRAEQAMHNLQGANGQKFTLGLVPHVAKFAIVSLVHHLRLQFPEAAITVLEGTSTMLLESLLIDRIDAAIMYETPRSDLITKRSLLQEELYFIGPARPGVVAAESMRFKDICRYPLIISSRMHAIRELVEAQASYGYALLPLNALKRDERKRKLSVTRLTDPMLHCRLVIATARQQGASTFICNALDVLEERVVPMYVAYEQGLSRRFAGGRN